MMLLNWDDPVDISLQSPNPLVVPILRTIPIFRNLRVLSFLFPCNSEVDISRLGLDVLCGFQELYIIACSLYCPEAPTTKIHVRGASIALVSSYDRFRFLPTLHLPSLQSLRIELIGRREVFTPDYMGESSIAFYHASPASANCLLRPTVTTSFLPGTGRKTLHLRPRGLAPLMKATRIAGLTTSVTFLWLELLLDLVYAWTGSDELFALLPCATSFHLTILPVRNDDAFAQAHAITPNTFLQTLAQIFRAPLA
ncbi:hypothetical protein B0H19DRAFT_1382665 [Mycena capillaripes]|nr:hypothetical protein B0H19DRAFT_1382665 [Mycena capillaripes]